MADYAAISPLLRAALMQVTVLLFIDAPTRVLFFVMAGLRPGHPRLSRLSSAKTWMPGTSPGTTSFAAKQRVDRR
jgi:hypothetical protein